MFTANAFLRGKLFTECKEYKNLKKSKQKKFVQAMFGELDQLQGKDPRGYMNIVKFLRNGTFDKNKSDDTSHVPLHRWREHFRDLLCAPVQPGPEEEDMVRFVEESCSLRKSELVNPFSCEERFITISSLKNNKAVCFDRVSNEMLKASKHVISQHLTHLFNAILSLRHYPKNVKDNILTPLHKSGDKDDPGHWYLILLRQAF